MEQKIINPTEKSPKSQMPDELMLKAMQKDNDRKGDVRGEWVYSNDYGIVWLPDPVDDMGGGTPPPNPATPPSILTELVQWGKSLDLDSVKPNSVMVIKLASDNPHHAENMQRNIINMILSPRAEKLKDKKLTVLFMSNLDDISILEEKEMEAAGWQKKDKKLIIDPFKH